MALTYRFGRFELYPATRQLLVDKQPALLGARALDVLLALIERRDRLVTKNELLDLVWPGLVVEENNLQVQIYALRKLLGQDAIATVPGRGYRFALEPTDAAGTQSPPGPGLLSVMVLPFQNLTGDANQAYVADGLTASLTSDLSRIRDAFIVNAATTFTYKNKPITAQQVGKELGVRFVLHGSVQRSGAKIRINAQLADTASNAQLWSDSFEGDQADLFALQDRVTTLVGNSIGREMVIVAARKSETRKTNSTVVDLVLRARALALKGLFSLANLQQQEDLYRQALALEPNNASAMVGLAGSLTGQAGNFGYQMDESVYEKKMVEGRDLALKAKEIDPDNPGIYVALGRYATSHDDLDGALRALETRLSLEPKDPNAYNSLATRLYYEGEPKRSIELLAQAINLDPKHPSAVVLAGMGRGYLMLGDNCAAIEWLLKTSEKDPAFARAYAYLAMAYAANGEDAKARATAAEARRLDPIIKLSTFEPARAQPAAYNEYYEKKFVPAWRKAGLPE